MSNYILVAKNIFKRIFKKPTGILIHIILPVATSVIFLLLFSGNSSSKYMVAVVDNSESVSSQNILDIIEDTGKYNIVHYSEEEITDAITESKASVAIIFDKDFEDLIISDGEPSVRVIAHKMSEASEWIKITIDYQIRNLADLAMAANYDKNAYIDIVEDTQGNKVTFTSETVNDISTELSATNQMFGMYLMLALISACQIAFIALRDKKTGVMSRILVTPIKNSVYTMANITVNLLIQFTQIVLIIFVAKYVFGLSYHTEAYNLIIILSVFAVCSVSVGQFIASVSKNASVAGAVMSLILTPTCMIGGCFWPEEFMPQSLRNLSFLMPQRWTLDAIKYSQEGEPYGLALLVILSFSILLYLVSVYIVKKQDKNYK